MDPTNAVYNSQGQQAVQAPSYEGEFLPDVTADPIGTNYFDTDWNLLYVLVRGSTPVDIITSPMVTVTFLMPAVTIDEFFGENLINNLALYLNIPAENIIIANAVSESRRRRKRASNTNEITVQISNPAPSSNATNATVMSAAELGNVSATLVNAVQLNTLGDALNVTILGADITEPLPEPNESSWEDLVVALDSGVSLEVSLQVPAEMEQTQGPFTGYEMSPITDTPKFHTLDIYVSKNIDFVPSFPLTSATNVYFILQKYSNKNNTKISIH